MRVVGAIVLVLVCEPVFASGPCVGTMTSADWYSALDSIDRYYAAQDLRNAAALITWTEARLPCLDALVYPPALARFAQQASFQATLDEEPDLALSWAQLAMVADPKHPLPDWMPASHTGRASIAGVDPPAHVTLDEVGLIFPRGGGVFLNGRFLSVPHGPVDTPNLVQTMDRRQRVVEGRWQHGVAFAPEFLGPDLGHVDPPQWYVPPSVRSRTSEFQGVGGGASRARQLQWAAGLGAAGAGLYATSWVTRAQYEKSHSDGLYYATNTTVVGSASATACAVALLTSALLTSRDSR